MNLFFVSLCFLLFSEKKKKKKKDWEPVFLSKKKSSAKKDQPKGDAAIAVAARSALFLFLKFFLLFSSSSLFLFFFFPLPSNERTGQHVDAQKKHAATTNKQHGGPLIDARKLEDPDSTVKLKTVSVDLKNQIQQARQAKGMTQKDLANKINEKQTVVSDYESGKAVPDPKVLSKMSKALGVQLKK